MHLPKSKGKSLHRNRKALQRAISEKPIKRDKGNECTKRCIDKLSMTKGVMMLGVLSFRASRGISLRYSEQPCRGISAKPRVLTLGIVISKYLAMHAIHLPKSKGETLHRNRKYSKERFPKNQSKGIKGRKIQRDASTSSA